MKSRFKKVLKGIFLTSMRSIMATSGAEASNYDIDKLKRNRQSRTRVKR